MFANELLCHITDCIFEMVVAVSRLVKNGKGLCL